MILFNVKLYGWYSKIYLEILLFTRYFSCLRRNSQTLQSQPTSNGKWRYHTINTISSFAWMPSFVCFIVQCHPLNEVWFGCYVFSFKDSMFIFPFSHYKKDVLLETMIHLWSSRKDWQDKEGNNAGFITEQWVVDNVWLEK